MRLFAALDPPTDVRAALVRLHQQVRPHGGDGGGGLRWSPAQNWHVTVAFFSEVPDRCVEDLAGRLRRAAARTRPLHLRLGDPGTFGSPTSASVLWLAVEGDREQLRRLAARARASGRRVGLQVESVAATHRYRPHLTLARGRPRADVTSALEQWPAAAAREPLRWTATELLLLRSDLAAAAGQAATHQVLARLPFTRDDGPR